MPANTFEYNINGNKYVVEIASLSADSAEVIVNGENYSVELDNLIGETPAVIAAKPVAVSAPRPVAAAVPRPKPAAPRPSVDAAAGELVIYAPLPGMITQILLAVGDTVDNGDTIMRMEAMKMENNIASTTAGTIKEIHVSEGKEVSDGTPLVTIAVE